MTTPGPTSPQPSVGRRRPADHVATTGLHALAGRPDVVAAAESARVAVDRLLRHRALRRQPGVVIAESALRGARASAALGGADWPLERVRSVHGPAGDGAAAIVHGALRVSAEIGALMPVWRRSPLQALARLHVLAAADLLPAAELGRPVSAGPRLVALVELVTRPAGVPAVVEAAVVHGELLVLGPFRRGTGLVARAAQRLVLLARGLDPQSLVAPEIGHAAAAGAYRAAAEGYRGGSPAAVAAWVVHCAGAVEAGAQDGLAFCEALTRAS